MKTLRGVTYEEKVYTVSANAVTVDLGLCNQSKIDLAAATGTVAITLTLPVSSISAGSILISPDDANRTLTWAVTGGSAIWIGDAFTSSIAANSPQLIYWRTSGTDVYITHAGGNLLINPACACVTTGAETYTISGGSVTQINGTVIDGYSPSIGDRILVTAAPAASGAGTLWVYTEQPANGIYVVTGNTTNLTISRVSDLSGSVHPFGRSVWVINGTEWYWSEWIVTTPATKAAFVYGTNNIKWTNIVSYNPHVGTIYASSIWLYLNGPYQARIENNGSATANQQFTLPAVTTDTLVSRTSTDTLTNKTLTSPVLTTPTLGVGAYTELHTTEISNTVTANASTIALGAGNHQKLDLASANSTVAVTLTLPSSGINTGTLLVIPDDVSRALTWAVTGGTAIWIGDVFSVSQTGVQAQLISWRTSGTNVYLAHTGGTVSESGTSSDLLSTLVDSEVSVTTTATLTISKMHVCSGTSSDYTVTLPPASISTGKLIGVRMATGLTKLVTVKGNASELINGLNIRIMHAGESAILLCDGASWFKIGGLSIPMTCFASWVGSSAGTDNTWVPVSVDTNTDGSLMYDATNDRISILRPGRYAANTFVSTVTATNILLSSLFVNASMASCFNGANPTGWASAANHVTLVAGDYLRPGYYKGGGSIDSLSITVTEIPSW